MLDEFNVVITITIIIITIIILIAGQKTSPPTVENSQLNPASLIGFVDPYATVAVQCYHKYMYMAVGVVVVSLRSSLQHPARAQIMVDWMEPERKLIPAAMLCSGKQSSAKGTSLPSRPAQQYSPGHPGRLADAE